MKLLLFLSFILVSQICASEPADSLRECNIVSVTGSEFDGDNSPQNVIDKDLKTRWSSNGEEKWLLFELDRLYTVNAVGIAFHNGHLRTFIFEVHTSADGENWQEVFVGHRFPGTREVINIPVKAAAAKYIKIVGLGNNRNVWNSYLEVEVYHE